jgi:hypothetical protein
MLFLISFLVFMLNFITFDLAIFINSLSISTTTTNLAPNKLDPIANLPVPQPKSKTTFFYISSQIKLNLKFRQIGLLVLYIGLKKPCEAGFL